MVEIIVIMNKTEKKPVAVAFKEQEKELMQLFADVGGAYKAYTVKFLLLGEGTILSETAKELDARAEREDELVPSTQPPDMGFPGLPL